MMAAGDVIQDPVDGAGQGQNPFSDCSVQSEHRTTTPNITGTVPLRARVYMGLVSGLSMGRIAKEAGCSRSTVHGITTTLCRQEIVRRQPGSRHPVLFERGPKANDLEVIKYINRKVRPFGQPRTPDPTVNSTPNIGPSGLRTFASDLRPRTPTTPNNQTALQGLETGGRIHKVQVKVSIDQPYVWKEVQKAFQAVKSNALKHCVARHECTFLSRDGPVHIAIQGPTAIISLSSFMIRSWGDLQEWFDYSALRIEAIKTELKEKAGLVLGKPSMPRLHCAFPEIGQVHKALFERVPIDFKLPDVWSDCSLGPPELEVSSYKLAMSMYLAPGLLADLIQKDEEKGRLIKELQEQVKVLREAMEAEAQKP